MSDEVSFFDIDTDAYSPRADNNVSTVQYMSSLRSSSATSGPSRQQSHAVFEALCRHPWTYPLLGSRLLEMRTLSTNG